MTAHDRLIVEGNAEGAVARTALMVLGMHRSGTSALTRALGLMGAAMPAQMMPARPGNEAGHWESEAVCDLNEAILASAGSHWADWTALNPAWYDQPDYAAWVARGVDVIAQEFGDAPLFAVKDPRNCRLARYWLDVLASAGAVARCILPMRNPLEVAASLERRDGIEERVGLLLWLRHVLDAEGATRGQARAFVDYADLLAQGEAAVRRIGDGLGVAWPRLATAEPGLFAHMGEVPDAGVSAQMAAWLDPGLRHHARDAGAVLHDAGLSAWVRDVYAVMLRWCREGEDARDYAVLDAVAAALNAAAPVFVPLLRGADARVSQIAARLSTAEVQVAHSNALFAEAVAARDTLAGQLAELGLRHAQAEDARALAVRDVQAARAEAQGLSAQGAAAEARLAEAEAEVADLRHAREDLESHLRQRQAEVRAAWAEVASMQAEVEQWRDTAAQAQARSDGLRGELARSEAWVFRLSAERAEAEAALRRQDWQMRALQAQTGATLAEARREVAAMTAQYAASAQGLQLAEARVEQLASDLAEAQMIADGVRERLVRVETDLAHARHHGSALELELAATQEQAACEAEVWSDRLNAATRAQAQVTQDLARAQALAAQIDAARIAADGARAEAEQALAQVEDQRDHAWQAQEAAEQARAQSQSQLEERFGEIATLTGLLQRQAQAAENALNQADLLRALQAEVLKSSGWWGWLPARWQSRVRYRRLRDKGLFDAAAYLQAYPDVAASGMDPLRHFVLHGLNEGRSASV
ncbi:hypothetical protein GTZ99_10025 [Novosphingobium sp. FSY-8]|uniref:Sulfotransferase family protein n=2 Tax=Novosphingobium ovatum TaxID=1908523 RepID=A0ABW9XEC1_9SPHN|nr:hypothetical protein [Novosphingobium ovatum]